MTLPPDWRDDVAFMLEFSGIGPGERKGLGNIVGQKRKLTDAQALFVARLAVQCFVETADYRALLVVDRNLTGGCNGR